MYQSLPPKWTAKQAMDISLYIDVDMMMGLTKLRQFQRNSLLQNLPPLISDHKEGLNEFFEDCYMVLFSESLHYLVYHRCTGAYYVALVGLEFTMLYNHWDLPVSFSDTGIKSMCLYALPETRAFLQKKILILSLS